MIIYLKRSIDLRRLIDPVLSFILRWSCFSQAKSALLQISILFIFLSSVPINAINNFYEFLKWQPISICYLVLHSSQAIHVSFTSHIFVTYFSFSVLSLFSRSHRISIAFSSLVAIWGFSFLLPESFCVAFLDLFLFSLSSSLSRFEK